MEPIEQHTWFTRSGKAMAALGRVIADFELPERLSLPHNRPVLMAGNHRSLLDLPATMAIFTKFGISSHIMVKQAFMEAPVGGNYLTSIGCIPTSRDLREQAEADAIEALKAGHIVSMMPEGRLVKPRDWVDGVGPGRPGVSRIAIAADAVVVPVGFLNTEKAWPHGAGPKLTLKRPKVHLRIGPAIEMESTDHQVNADRVMQVIADLLADR